MKTFAINFSEVQLQVLAKALDEIPHKYAAPVIAHINAEIQKTHLNAANVNVEQGQANQMHEAT